MPVLQKLSTHQREILIRAILVGFAAGLWFSVLYTFLIVLLVLAWLIDDSAATFRQMIAQPLVQSVLVLCALLLLGLFWSEAPFEGRHKWTKYFLLLVYLPFLALLNRQRLPWVIGAVLAGYCLVLFAGLYEWRVESRQGIPAFNMSYLTFSAMLGVGCVVTCCFACLCRNTAVRFCLAAGSLALLYIQFHQSARGFLLATLLTLAVMLTVHFRITLRKFAAAVVPALLVTLLLAYTSPVVQERWTQAKEDIERMQLGHFNSSIGYRIALWDVGLYGIAQKPLLGQGTGMPEQFFDQTVVHYKQGLYQNLPDFQQTSHYHNDWIEIGMQLGVLGLGSLLFLLRAWYRTFDQNGLTLPGICVVSFIVISGITETFLTFGRIPVLLLVLTAVAVSWQREATGSSRAADDNR
ncbi:O-antigen ligase [Nitrosomonas sp. Nm51]|uniref:O-antigen ligase family protein n=1 Tax=Nitrosomonas sp. Nm51 TaxID=133720 RepID=UPI0008CB7602|nr:O-antigen ligase family protein [Nitrosomonas sp. Nm51]SER64117.1 O-antigen ligase [Nitrosomonas sp. Nm51]